jgi:hypothetical protein
MQGGPALSAATGSSPPRTSVTHSRASQLNSLPGEKNTAEALPLAVWRTLPQFRLAHLLILRTAACPFLPTQRFPRDFFQRGSALKESRPALSLSATTDHGQELRRQRLATTFLYQFFKELSGAPVRLLLPSRLC